MSDGDDSISELQTIAWAKGSQETYRLALDRILAGQAQGERIILTIGGKTFEGRMTGFDGERVAVLHDTGAVTVVWVKSGVALTTSSGIG